MSFTCDSELFNEDWSLTPKGAEFFNFMTSFDGIGTEGSESEDYNETLLPEDYEDNEILLQDVLVEPTELQPMGEEMFNRFFIPYRHWIDA